MKKQIGKECLILVGWIYAFFPLLVTVFVITNDVWSVKRVYQLGLALYAIVQLARLAAWAARRLERG